MSERYNLSVPRETKEGKTYWDKVGVMFKRDKGGYSISLSMFPGLHIMAFPVDDDREQRQEQPRQQRNTRPQVLVDDSEELPF